MPSRLGRAASAAVLVALAAAAALEAQAGPDPAPEEANAFAPVAGILKYRCALSGCHTGDNAAQGMILEPDQVRVQTVNQSARTEPGYQRIVPGQPAQSLLYLKLLAPEEGGYRGRRMPYRDEPLSPEEIALVRRWIEALPAAPPAAADAPSAGAPSAAGAGVERLFHDSYLANLPTPDALGRRTLDFRILHRFRSSTRQAGGEELYGLDGGAEISLGLVYGFSDRLEGGIRRTGLQQDYEFFVKSLLAPQRQGVPASLAGRLSYSSARDETFANRSRWGAQLIFGCRVNEILSVLLAPTYVWRSNWEEADDTDGTAALGIGAEWRLTPSHAITTEWIRQGDGVKAPFQGVSVGYSVATAGHAFHLLLTNTLGTHTDLYAPGGDLDLEEKHLRIGFNISRTTRFRSGGLKRSGRP